MENWNWETIFCRHYSLSSTTDSSVLGKVFDLVVLDKYSDQLVASDLQFGFKARRSTNMCSMVLKETIAYYVNNRSTVYCTMLDATKAFDRVEYAKLFRNRHRWKMRDQISRVEKCGTGKCKTKNAGWKMEDRKIEDRKCRGGKCRTGKCGTTV